MQLAAWQGPRRLERVERHGVRTRQPEGLRRVGGGRKRGLVVRGRAAVLPQVRGQPEPVPDAHSLPRTRRLPDRVGGAVADTVGRGVLGRRSRAGLREPRHQRSAPTRVHDHADDHAPG